MIKELDFGLPPPKRGQGKRTPEDGLVEVAKTPDGRVSITVEHAGNRQVLVCGTFNAGRVAALVCSVLGVKMPKVEL